MYPSWHMYIYILIGLATGFVAAVSGGGGLISIPALLLLGVPPHVTLATSKFGGIGGATGALYKYFKEKKIIWHYALRLSAVGIVASIIGSKLIISINTEILNQIIGVLLLVLIPTIFLKKDFGLTKNEHSKRRNGIGYFVYFFLAIVASFFGPVGSMMIATVIYFFGLPMIEANATDYFSFAVLSFVAVIVYGFNGLIDYKIGIILFVSMWIGGNLGAHVAIKKGDKWVKIIFAAVVLVSSLKVLLG